MRSVPAGSYARICDVATLWQAWLQVRSGKRRGATMASFDLDADRYLFALSRALIDGSYRPGPYALRAIQDPKRRLIAAPCVADRVLHRALLDDIGPTYQRSYLPQCYTRGAGAGVHQAVIAYLGNLRRYRWRCHLDIAGYFPSLPLARLEALLFHRLADPRTRALITRLLNVGARVYRTHPARDLLGPPHAGRTGLPLGSYLSQWCGNQYLDGLDHLIKRGFKVPGYLRYMDDFVLFDDDRDRLVETRAGVARWLHDERGLALNPKRGQLRPDREPSVFLGYRISRGGIAASRKLRRRLKHRVRSAARRGDVALERTLQAYRGILLLP